MSNSGGAEDGKHEGTWGKIGVFRFSGLVLILSLNRTKQKEGKKKTENGKPRKKIK